MERYERQPFKRSLAGDKRWVSIFFLVQLYYYYFTFSCVLYQLNILFIVSSNGNSSLSLFSQRFLSLSSASRLRLPRKLFLSILNSSSRLFFWKVNNKNGNKWLLSRSRLNFGSLSEHVYAQFTLLISLRKNLAFFLCYLPFTLRTLNRGFSHMLS